jgi:hypothetical protein
LITAEKLALLTNFPAAMLTVGIQQAGYKKDQFNTAKFLGLSNANVFVYSVTYVEDKEVRTTKVFVKYDPTADKVSIDY